MVGLLGETWTARNVFRRLTCRKPIKKRKKPRVGYFPLPTGKIVPFKTYVKEMGETPDLLEARPLGWDENKEERRVNKKARKRIFRSIFLASLALFLFSYGYNQISMMQNYLHESQFFMQIKYMPDYENMYGHVQLCTKYGLALLTSVFVPYVIRTFKDKWILFFTIGTYSIFISLSFFDAKYTIIPSGIIAGLSCIPFFTTFSMYMVHIAYRLGDLNTKRPYNGVQGNWLLLLFNTLAFIAWYFGFALASATSAFVSHGILQRNDSYVKSHNVSCGKNYCDQEWPNWWDIGMQQETIPQIDIYAYANITNASCGIFAMALMLFGCVEGQTTKVFTSLKDDKGFELNFKLGWRAIFNWNNTLLAPIFVFIGWSLDFIAYSFTRAYIICSVDSWNLYIALASFGALATIVAAFSPWVAIKPLGARCLMITGVTCYAACLIFLYFWRPVASINGYHFGSVHPDKWEYAMFYAVPSLWGVGASCLHTVINLKIEFEYPDPDDMIQLFTLYNHWKALGVLIGYVFRNTSTCTDVKLYFLFFLLLLGSGLYVVYERKRLKNPNAIKLGRVTIVRCVPNPNPENMANESDVEEEGTSTSEEEDENSAVNGRRRKKTVHYKREPPPNDPRLGSAWRTPHLPPNLDIPRKYITPDGNIMIMPKDCKPPFEVQDSFDSNVLRKTDMQRVSMAARKVCFQLGYGGKPLFFDVDELLNNPDEEVPCKFDARGEVLPGKEDEPDYTEEHLASNPCYHIPERFDADLEEVRRMRNEVRNDVGTGSNGVLSRHRIRVNNDETQLLLDFE